MASASRGAEESGTVAVSITGSNLTSSSALSLHRPHLSYSTPDLTRSGLPYLGHLALCTNYERTGPHPLPELALSTRRGALHIYLALCMLRRVERVDNHGSSDIYLSISSA
jgi:uncharacterized membrane protein YbjE (DUF340 family)